MKRAWNLSNQLRRWKESRHTSKSVLISGLCFLRLRSGVSIGGRSLAYPHVKHRLIGEICLLLLGRFSRSKQLKIRGCKEKTPLRWAKLINRLWLSMNRSFSWSICLPSVALVATSSARRLSKRIGSNHASSKKSLSVRKSIATTCVLAASSSSALSSSTRG